VDARPDSLAHVKILIVCPEPLSRVTGGIGTYSRELARTLLEQGNEVEVLTRAPDKQDLVALEESGVTIGRIQISEKIPFNVFPLQLEESFHIWRTIEALLRESDYDLIEFPDYEAVGYFTIQAKAAGHKVPKIAVRLHSPQFMLHDDNNVTLYDLSTKRLRAAELESILRADVVLYAAPAMLKRIEEYIPKTSRLRQVEQISHPVPKALRPLSMPSRGEPETHIKKIGCIGRQEFRKGWDLIFRNGIFDWEKIEFHLIGRDTALPNGESCLANILSYLPEDRRNKVVVHGYQEPSRLATLAAMMDGFIFPSRFENFPNALLEVLGLGKPIMVSKHGGMPFIGSGNKFVKEFDPFNKFELKHLMEEIDPIESEFSSNSNIAHLYSKLASGGSDLSVGPETKKVTVVIPLGPESDFLREAVSSALNTEVIDEVIVVGNNRSGFPDELKYFDTHIVKYYEVELNGPGSARIWGLKKAKNQLIQFLDSDDLLIPAVVERHVRCLSSSEFSPDVVTGGMQLFGLESHEWIPSSSSPSLILSENFTHSGLLVNRESMTEIPHMDSTHDEDWILSQSFVLSGLFVAIDPDVGYLYRSRKESRSKSNASNRFESNFIRLKCFERDFKPQMTSLIFLKEIYTSNGGSAGASEMFTRLEKLLRRKFESTRYWGLVKRVGYFFMKHLN